MSEKFKWIVKEKIPPPVRFVRKRKEYDECIEEFLDSDFETVRVNIPTLSLRTSTVNCMNASSTRDLKGKSKHA